jgi:hypothetical protein
MNVRIGTVATQFLSWEYLFRIFGIMSLQCRTEHGWKDDFVKRKIIHRNPRSWAPSQYWASTPPPSPIYHSAFPAYSFSLSSLCVAESYNISPGMPVRVLAADTARFAHASAGVGGTAASVQEHQFAGRILALRILFLLTHATSYSFYSSVTQLLYTVKEKGGNPDRKPHSLPNGLRNPYRNLNKLYVPEFGFSASCRRKSTRSTGQVLFV